MSSTTTEQFCYKACETCKLKDVIGLGPGKSLIRKGSNIMLVVDYMEDDDFEYGTPLSNLTSRVSSIGGILSYNNLALQDISISSALRCLTKRGFPPEKRDYTNCAQTIHDEIKTSEIKYLFIMGALPAAALTDSIIMDVDKMRGKIITLSEGVKAVITYSISMISQNEGCGSCGRSMYKFLIRKDLGILLKEVQKDAIHNGLL